LHSGAENHTTDTTKTIDAYFDSHDLLSLLKKPNLMMGAFAHRDCITIMWAPKTGEKR